MKKGLKVLFVIVCALSILACNKNTKNDKDINDNALVLYFSATGTTEKVAKTIAYVTGSDIIKIIPEEKYTTKDLDYNDNNSRANLEQDDAEARPKIKNTIDVAKYDTIYLGYPIWMGKEPKIILTLLDYVDFSGKIVIPFCTSGGSGIERSLENLKLYNSKIEWLDGKRFDSKVTEEEIKEWINSLKRKK